MKTTVILPALLTCFLIFISCSADDENSDTIESNNPELVAKLQGKWLLEGFTINGGEFLDLPQEEEVFYEFKSGGALTFTFPGGSEQSTYQVINNTLIMGSGSDTGIYDISNVTDSGFRLSGKGDTDGDQILEDIVLFFIKV